MAFRSAWKLVRQRFETEEDLIAEREIVSQACIKWKCNPIKLPDKYRVDFMLLRNDKFVALCEVRDRGQKYATYMLSLHKLMEGMELSSVLKIPFFLLVRFPDGIMFCKLHYAENYTYAFGGMNNPRDWQDQEPMVFIPMKEFKEL